MQIRDRFSVNATEIPDDLTSAEQEMLAWYRDIKSLLQHLESKYIQCTIPGIR